MSVVQQPQFDRFIAQVNHLVHTIDDEAALTQQVAAHLTDLLAGGLELPESVTRPEPDRYVMYPLHVAVDGSFSVASAVWNVRQSTPVHGHETWGVVGIHSGVESEVRYQKPQGPGVPLITDGSDAWAQGQVTVCCTTDDDVHQVSCGSDIPCVGIHVYGADIGTLPRRSYVPETGEVSWFTSTWATPAPVPHGD